ncbi:hypothetical protein CKQ53_12925 [Lonsdalea britannica]|uniref:Uncharacterized protein n=1 Tax=Lonsdalea britannica TaxID=1082704 RepID=A0AAD0SHE5_9GAMM|nr:hypothetical protein CKQ53_12925 [Lonsdalea britannica]
MSKKTYLHQLNEAMRIERESRHHKARATYKNKPKDRWLEVVNAHNRRLTRQCRRSVGKSNKLGVRRTAKGMCMYLNEIQSWSLIFRSNREVK